ncbi:MAG: ribosome maturation factor RimM [Thiomargarita sp.]|nr:ribosome maturation factor RimM [Thiomargarita sp.]
MSDRIIIGQINGLYGVQGWVKVYSYTEPIVNIINYSPWQLYLQTQWQTWSILAGKKQGKGIIARLENVIDRTQATNLLGAEIAIERSQLPATSNNEYYWSDLIGLTVINQDNITLGKVDHLLATGANDVLVLAGKPVLLIPFVLEHVVLKVDLANRILQVDWDTDF